MHVDAHVRDRLGAVEQSRNTTRPGARDQAAHRKHGSQGVGDVGAGQQARTRPHQRFDLLRMHFAVRIHRCDDQFRTGLLAYHLPRHDVRVVFEMGDQHFIAVLQQRAGEALRDQIDSLGRAAHEQHLVARAGVDIAHHAIPCALVQCGSLLAQRMHSAVNVGVMMPLIVIHSFDHGQRALRRRAVVEIGKGLVMHLARQDREVLAHAHDVKYPGNWFGGGCAHRNLLSMAAFGSRVISALSII